MIGENATPQDPFESRESCFEIGVGEDMIKEGRQVLALDLDSDDDCVCLGRDGAIVTVLPNGGGFSSLSHNRTCVSLALTEYQMHEKIMITSGFLN